VGAAGLLRPHLARHRDLGRQVLHRGARRPADRGGCAQRPPVVVGADAGHHPGLFDHRCAARVRRQGGDRQWWRRLRRARVCQCLRCADRPQAVEVLSGARRSIEGSGRRGLRQRDGDGREDLERPMCGHGVCRRRVRSSVSDPDGANARAQTGPEPIRAGPRGSRTCSTAETRPAGAFAPPPGPEGQALGSTESPRGPRRLLLGRAERSRSRSRFFSLGPSLRRAERGRLAA
jgi:hypothetical protein